MNYPNSYISVIGAGSWGTTLASLLAEKGYDVTLWAHEKDLAERINRERINNIYLPDFAIPVNLKATHDIVEAVSNSRYILNVVPTQYIRSIFTQVKQYIRSEAIIISASKGIENDTLLTPSMILKEILGRPVSTLSGPSFAKEVAAKLPTAVTLASEDRKAGLLLQEIFNTDYFRVYTHDDIIGVEVGGALKNVVAIAAGICDGLGLGHNSRAALITRGLSEITRLGISMNAREITFSGLSGLGDLVLTCTGPLSRNYTVGYKLGQGQKLSDIISQTRSVAEGVATTLSAYDLSKKYSIDMPITEQVYLTLYKEKPPKEAVRDLMNRTLKSEFYGY
ncbi:MAG: NAD(P)-dependent glycerol-3-phosphate dehydrogenase [Nitrospirae bacterium]|jgi:glycerol-3-phosphate dehydrogenase (NAD(P)+)|nr:NAD(P)-dependent glycerol-3-phosphate dehydrogenase [Nitrospirota bacterium]MCL5063141.1 NAD(P)-dependent glycerol-3-phosphate dehydrogenase [Nitrospirota bacterium]MDA8215405.1 NAD(P)-dependent glycerol-3-phosphate dehydrogenase [Nitrospiraceae bacterium]MDA8338839.1 NAD(P)-dependent glycerol-3-phosphate dehydrogenase [Nitrospiraceae bacterium]